MLFIFFTSFKVCVACCDDDYCNESVPTNATNANFQRTRTAAYSSSRRTVIDVWLQWMTLALLLTRSSINMTSLMNPWLTHKKTRRVRTSRKRERLSCWGRSEEYMDRYISDVPFCGYWQTKNTSLSLSFSLPGPSSITSHCISSAGMTAAFVGLVKDTLLGSFCENESLNRKTIVTVSSRILFAWTSLIIICFKCFYYFVIDLMKWWSLV